MEEQLLKRLRGWAIPAEGSWADGYREGYYDFCYMDEFDSCKDVGFWNKLLDGQKMRLNLKKEHMVEKEDKLPVILVSNLHPREQFLNAFPS